MKIFDYYSDYDFGHDLYVTLGQFENFNIIDFEIHTSEYWSWEPNIRLTFEFFAGTIFTIKLSALSFSVDFAFVSYKYPYNLSHTKE